MTEIWDEEFAKVSDEPLGLDLPEEEEEISNNLLTLLGGRRLYKEDIFFGQKIRLRTLRAGEELECGLLVSRYNGTPEEGRAYITAVVAAAIDTVNGKPLLETLGPIDEEEQVKRQFDYVRTKWYWPQIQRIYEQGYIPLLDELRLALDEIQSK